MMKVLLTAFLGAIASVSADSCTAEDIQTWSTGDFTQKLLAFSMSNSTKKRLFKSFSKTDKFLVDKLMPKALVQLGLSEDCTGCYLNNIVCTFRNCASVCAVDPLGADCRACNLDKCMPSLLACVGPAAAASMPGEPDASTLQLAVESDEVDAAEDEI